MGHKHVFINDLMNEKTAILHNNVDVEDASNDYDIELRVPNQNQQNMTSFGNPSTVKIRVNALDKNERSDDFVLYQRNTDKGRNSDNWIPIIATEAREVQNLKQDILNNKSNYRVSVTNLGRVYVSVLKNKGLKPVRFNRVNKTETL